MMTIKRILNFLCTFNILLLNTKYSSTYIYFKIREIFLKYSTTALKNYIMHSNSDMILWNMGIDWSLGFFEGGGV